MAEKRSALPFKAQLDQDRSAREKRRAADKAKREAAKKLKAKKGTK
jgi:hypothetical protein